MAATDTTRKRANRADFTDEEWQERKRQQKYISDKKYRDGNIELLAKKKAYREANKEKVSEGKKDWYRRNSDHVINKVKLYAKVNAHEVKLKAKIYREKNTEKIAEYNRSFRALYPERIKEYGKNWRLLNKKQKNESSKQWYETNKARAFELSRAWRKRNRGKVAALTMRRIATQKNATPFWSEHAEIKKVYVAASALKHHVDHIVPINSKIVCGLHVLANLQILPPSDNIRKSNRYWPDMP